MTQNRLQFLFVSKASLCLWRIYRFTIKNKFALSGALWSVCRSAIKALRPLWHFLLCFQLVISPVYSVGSQSSDNGNPPPSDNSKPLSDSANPTEGTLDQNSLQALNQDFMQAQVQTVEAFNKKVDSLNQHIFGPRTTSEQGTDHPLDFYSLIGQKVEMQSAGFWERRNPYYKETVAFMDKTTAFMDKIKSSALIKRKRNQGTTEDLSPEDNLKDEGQKSQNQESAEAPTADTEQKAPQHTPRPFFTKIKPENLVVNIVTKNPSVSLGDSPTSEMEQEIIVARINSQGDKISKLVASGIKRYENLGYPSAPTIVNRSYGPQPIPHYAGKSFVIPSETQEFYNFNISYQGQVLHRFSNNIQWISFFGPYLVFQEKSRIYENKTELSFIDLSYFHLAIGKTALPVFHLPIDLTLNPEVQTEPFHKGSLQNKKEAFLHPENIYINPQALKLSSAGDLRQGRQSVQQSALTLIGTNSTKYEVHQSEIDESSRVQQVLFNVLVSMLKTDKYERDMLPFFKEIAHTMENLLKNPTDQAQKGPAHPSESILKQVVAELLHSRVDIGSPSHHAGHYGHVKAAQHRIKPELDKRSALLKALNEAEGSKDPEQEKLIEDLRQKLSELNISELDKATYDRSVTHLEKDQAFQKALNSVSETKFARRKIGERIKGLWLYLTLPQPLGAPKIQEALGIMANAVRKGETVQDRYHFFKEGFKQLTASPKARIVGVPVLAGMASFASPEMAEFFEGIFLTFTRSIEVFSNTSGEFMSAYLPNFINPTKWSQAYIRDGNIGPFAIGLSAIGASMLLFYYAFHFPVNLKKFIDYLRTQKAKNHHRTVFSYLKQWPSEFKSFVTDMQAKYARDLAVGEFKHLGLPVKLSLPDGSELDVALKTFERISSMMADFKNPDFTLNLEFKINEGEQVVRFSTQENVKQAHSITLEITPSPEERASRIFFLQKGYLSDMLKEGTLVDNVAIELTGQKAGTDQTSFLYKAQLMRLNFTSEDMLKLQEVLTGTQYQKLYDDFIEQTYRSVEKQHTLAETQENLTKKEIGFLKALQIFFFSLPSFNNTQQNLNNTWNVWFLLRSFWFTVMYPNRLATIVLFTNYFDRTYGEMHRATKWNGGFRLRGAEFVQGKSASGREYISALRALENQIIQVERQYLRASFEQAYLQALTDSLKEGKPMDFLLNKGVQKQLGSFNFLPVDDPVDKNNLKLGLRDGRASEIYQAIVSLSGASSERLNKRDSLFIELFQNRMFEESMRDYMKEQLGIDKSANDQEVLNRVREKLNSGENVAFRLESLDEVRDRVRKVSAEKNIAQVMKENATSWHKALWEKLRVKHNRNMENMLNPRKNLQMERYYVSKLLGQDTEAMARATRYSMVQLIIDKPIELAFMFAMMAGVTEGILKPLYSEPFNERAFFYMSTYLVWANFYFNFIFSTMAASWFKLQRDAQTGFQGGFNKFPTKEELTKKLPALRYFWKHSHGKKDSKGKIDPDLATNTLFERYKFGWRIILSNFMASVPTFTLMFATTLGRFDMEFYLGGMFFAFLLPLVALFDKVEGIYESSAGYASRQLVKKGIDIKKFAHHPVVQQILLKRAFKDRINFNLLNALMLNNILGNSADIVENMSNSDGARAIHRAFFPENHIWTSYWDKMSESTQKVFSTVSQLCKKAFTNNRLDIGE